MLFKYYIKHEGLPENIGFVVASKHEEVLQIAKDRFKGWGIGSRAGCEVIKDMQPKKQPIIKSDLSWINKIFKDL